MSFGTANIHRLATAFCQTQGHCEEINGDGPNQMVGPPLVEAKLWLPGVVKRANTAHIWCAVQFLAINRQWMGLIGQSETIVIVSKYTLDVSLLCRTRLLSTTFPKGSLCINTIWVAGKGNFIFKPSSMPLALHVWANLDSRIGSMTRDQRLGANIGEHTSHQRCALETSQAIEAKPWNVLEHACKRPRKSWQLSGFMT